MADEYYGYVGTLLKVDLTNMTVEKIPTDTYDLDKWIGGRGLGSIIQWTECDPSAGALDPENVSRSSPARSPEPCSMAAVPSCRPSRRPAIPISAPSPAQASAAPSPRR